ncbi:MAG: Fe-S cluster assembly protein SufD [Elusimicrobia bacterium]|nr:Fe-S cluster assembly protein SufD [Elusimicrobiota bacterium]
MILKKIDPYPLFSQSSPENWAMNFPWLQNLKNSSLSRFKELGYPTPKQEDWKFTNLDPIFQTTFQIAENLPSDLSLFSAWKPIFLQIPNSIRLVFLNGYFAPELSGNLDALRKTPVRVEDFYSALKSNPDLIENKLAQIDRDPNNAFSALNTAFFQDGALIDLPDNTVLEMPIHLLFLTANQKRPSVTYPRVLVSIGRNCTANIIESYIGANREKYLTNAVTEISVGENSRAHHCKVQIENLNAVHMGRLTVRQNRDSEFTSHLISLGGQMARNELQIALDGEGAFCALNGLYKAGTRQHVDNQTLIDHLQPHGTSRELYKGILDGQSRAVFNGRIIVRPNAQKTDAIQSNKNLLLSDEGVIHSKPELKIFANDVKCKHGATIGRMDADMLFYLRSRGIGEEEAKRLLILAFASEIIDKIPIETLRHNLHQTIFEGLSHLGLPGGKT